MTKPDYDDPLHVRTMEPCEWCGAEWVKVRKPDNEPPVEGLGWVMDHYFDCEYIGVLDFGV